MIRVGDILAYVADRLDLSAQAGFANRGVLDSFYRHLNNGIKTIAMRWPVVASTEDYTTTASAYIPIVSDYRVIRVDSIVWPKGWATPEYVTPQEMRKIINRIQEGSLMGTSQPYYWTYIPNDAAIELQNSNYIEADLPVTIKYSYVLKFQAVGVNYGKDQEIPMPEDYQHLWELYVTRAMAPKANKDIVQLLYAEYQEEFNNIGYMRTQFQHNEVDFRPRLKF